MSDFTNLIALLIVLAGSASLLWICRRDPLILFLNAVVIGGVASLLVIAARFSGIEDERLSPLFLLPLLAVIGALLVMNWKNAQRLRILRRAMGDVAEREERLMQAAELAKLGYYYYDTQAQRIVDCTEQHARSHGLNRDEYLAKASTLANGMPLIHPDDRALLKRKYNEVLDGKQVELSYRVMVDDGMKHVREITQPVFDDAGKVIAEIGTTMDITEQVQNENRLLLSQKMDTMAKISAGVAHDFNNLLSVIQLNQETLLGELESSSLRRHAKVSLDAVERGSKLATSLQSFARQSDLQPQVFDLNALVKRTHGWSESFLPANVQVEVSFLAGLWPVEADPGLAENVILNLMLNALDAMPGGGKLTIETANIRVEKEYVAARQESLLPGRYVLLAVSDTGIGISPEHTDRVFEPFFTTKGSAKGSGLGLSMVLGFMKQSNGTVRLYSEPGIGSSFNLYFPAADSEISYQINDDYSDAEGTANTPVFRKRASIEARLLLVEDEHGIREIAAKGLEMAGFHVVSAESGDKAFDIYRKDTNFDVLITDIVMPGQLNGPALAKAIRKLSPTIPVIFLSGYPAEASVHGNGLQPRDIRLQKPYRMADLVERIEELLSGRSRHN